MYHLPYFSPWQRAGTRNNYSNIHRRLGRGVPALTSFSNALERIPNESAIDSAACTVNNLFVTKCACSIQTYEPSVLCDFDKSHDSLSCSDTIYSDKFNSCHVG